MICKLVAAPALLLVIAALAAFAAVLITGTIISFHRDCSAQAGPGGHVRSPDPGPGCPPDEGNRTARALTRESHQNGHGTKKGRKGNKGRTK